MRIGGRHGGSTKPVLVSCTSMTPLLELKGDRAKNEREQNMMSPCGGGALSSIVNHKESRY